MKSRSAEILSRVYKEFLVAMLFLSAAASLLLLIRFSLTGSNYFGFLIWNLILAWLPSLISLYFTKLNRKPGWKAISLALLWLLFLPNAFYIVSDFVHVRSGGQISVLFDIVLLFSFTCIGFILGLASLGVMHIWVRRYISERLAATVIGIVILLCSFAIYLGRYLRWNSWDIITNPLGLLVDVSDRVINPLDHPRTVSTTLLFFALISVSYITCWWMAKFLYKNFRQLPSNN